MKISGFGDSFITYNDLEYSYTNSVGRHFNTNFDHYGKAGSGAWDAFFTFLDNKVQSDVVIFVWSAEHRTYHPHYSDICPSAVERNLGKEPIWLAAKHYYQYLYDARKAYFEHLAFYQYVDDYLVTNYPECKFIHMWSFPNGNSYTSNGEYIKPIDDYTWGESAKFNYIYRFKHGVEIRPALINLSYRDGWMDDLSKETRCHHLTPAMHNYLSKYVIDAIENYSSGRLIEIS